VSFCSFPRHPKIVALYQHTFFRDVCDVDAEPANVQNVACRRVHTALGRRSHAGGLTNLAKSLSAIIEEEFRNSVVVRDEKIGIAGAPQVRREASQRPAASADPELPAHLFKSAVAQVPEQILPSAVLGVFEALGHYFG